MIFSICLLWVGFQLNAPTWYYALLVFALILQVLNLGIKLGKK